VLTVYDIIWQLSVQLCQSGVGYAAESAACCTNIQMIPHFHHLSLKGIGPYDIGGNSSIRYTAHADSWANSACPVAGASEGGVRPHPSALNKYVST
jgi:hypothetical protein